MLRFLRRFPFALKGIARAIRTDTSFRTQVWGGLLVFLVLIVVARPLTEIELLFFILSWILVLITELQNSAFEAALDRLHPERHDEIGKSKDMAAGAVFLAGLFALCVVTTIICSRFI